MPKAKPRHIRVLLLVVAWLATVAIWSTTLAWLMAEKYWLADMLTHFPFQRLLLAGVLTCLFLWLRFPVASSLCCIAAFANLWLSVDFQARPTNETKAPELTLMSLNLYARNPTPEKAFALIEAKQPDVVALFEYRNAMAKWLVPLDASYPYQSGPLGDLLLLSRHPIERSSNTVYSGFGTKPRVIVLPSGKRITLVLAHPNSPISLREWQWRNRSFRMLAEFCAAETGPLVALGDFNSTRHSPHFQQLLRDGGLRQTHQQMLPAWTWPTHLPAAGIRIDHFLLKGDTLRIIDERNGPDVGSDHLPIFLDLCIDAP